jgi:hypothetical protein
MMDWGWRYQGESPCRKGLLEIAFKGKDFSADQPKPCLHTANSPKTDKN